MEPKNLTIRQHVSDSILATVHPELVAVAFCAAGMAALAWHFGIEVMPAIRQRYDCAAGPAVVWEIDERVLPGYGPLQGVFDREIIRAGFVGAQIGLSLQDGSCGVEFVHRTRPRHAQLNALYKRFGLRPEQTAAGLKTCRRRHAGDACPLGPIRRPYRSQCDRLDHGCQLGGN